MVAELSDIQSFSFSRYPSLVLCEEFNCNMIDIYHTHHILHEYKWCTNLTLKISENCQLIKLRWIYFLNNTFYVYINIPTLYQMPGQVRFCFVSSNPEYIITYTITLKVLYNVFLHTQKSCFELFWRQKLLF